MVFEKGKKGERGYKRGKGMEMGEKGKLIGFIGKGFVLNYVAIG